MWPFVFGISTWSILLTIGMLTGLFAAAHEVSKRKIMSLENFLAGTASSAFAGLFFTGLYTTVLLKGGLVQGQIHLSFITGVIGGFVAFVIIFRKYDLGQLLNITVPYLVLAHGFGRLGCLAWGCCYGFPSKIWGVTFQAGTPAAVRYGVGVAVFPMQAVESLSLFLLAAVLYWGVKFRYRVCFYMILYGTLRFVLEIYRSDQRGVWELWGVVLSVPQWQSLVSVFVGICCLLVLRRRIRIERYKNLC